VPQLETPGSSVRTTLPNEEGRGAAAAPRHGRVPARPSGPLLQPLRESHPRRGATGDRSTARPGRRRAWCRTTTTCNSDYKVGYIDRHNYFEGQGPEMFASMLSRPGSGYFSSGLPAGDRPTVRPVGVDSRLSQRLRRGRAGHRGGLRHGLARLGRPPTSSKRRPAARCSATSAAISRGASGRRTCRPRWASSRRWRG